MASEKLLAWHQEHASDLEIDSIDFTYRLIEEVQKCKTETDGKLPKEISP